MKTLIFLLLFCHAASTVKHSMKYFITGSSGVPNISELLGVGVVDGIQTCYCDSSKKRLEPSQGWAKTVLENDPELLKWHRQQCFVALPNFSKTLIFHLKQQFNKSGGVHIIQRIDGCEWDESTGEVIGFIQYAYNGEGFLEFDMKTLTWTALKPEAGITKRRWDADRESNQHNKFFLTEKCPEVLKMYFEYGKSSLQRTVLPSMSLLQKTPSSPVSCHATGFYPDRAMMFWRKDGEKIQTEGMDYQEILPNNDGTFQMSADLNVSSFTPDDWRRYECVFQLSDSKESIVAQVDKEVIRRNWGKKCRKKIHIITAVISIVVLILIAAVGFAKFKKKKDKRRQSSPGNNAGVSEKLSPDAYSAHITT